MTPFNPLKGRAASQRAFAALWTLADGWYRQDRLAKAMADATGVGRSWAEELLRWPARAGQIPRKLVVIRNREAAIVYLSRERLRRAFPDFDPDAINAPALELTPLKNQGWGFD